MFPALKESPLAAFCAALVIALLTTPLARTLAWKCGALARPGGRRVHEKPVAQWGGLAIFAGVAFAALLWRQPGPADVRWLAPSNNPLIIAQTQQTLHLSTVFFGCGLLILLLGMADDKWELPAWAKFGGQILIVYLMWRGNVRIQTLPFSSGTQPLSPNESLLLTELWVLGLMNGINFIDGVDGLASGVCAIAAGSLCIIEILQGATWAAAAAAAVCGACLGFLRWNFYPAQDLSRRCRRFAHRLLAGGDCGFRRRQNRRRDRTWRADVGFGHSRRRYIMGRCSPHFSRTSAVESRPGPFAPSFAGTRLHAG